MQIEKLCYLCHLPKLLCKCKTIRYSDNTKIIKIPDLDSIDKPIDIFSICKTTKGTATDKWLSQKEL